MTKVVGDQNSWEDLNAKMVISNVGKNKYRYFLVKCLISNAGNVSIQRLPVQTMTKIVGEVSGHSFHAI